MQLRKILIFTLFFVTAFVGKTLAEEDEKEDAMVEEEGETATEPATGQDYVEEEEEDDSGQLRPSTDVITHFLFVDPPNSPELTSGKLAKVLVSFENVGSRDFIVLSMEASLRYPGDYSYYIHNYTTLKYNHLAQPETETTFEYMFMPFETLAGRSFILAMNLNYKLNTGKLFSNNVFNGTISINEELSNWDAETVFLYVVFCCLAVLAIALFYQFVLSKKKKLGLSRKPAAVEMGTSNVADVDLEWIPKSALLLNNNASKTPRQRKAGRTQTAGDG